VLRTYDAALCATTQNGSANLLVVQILMNFEGLE
jgi:hypothetical protein